jgi:hypothetical protein
LSTGDEFHEPESKKQITLKNVTLETTLGQIEKQTKLDISQLIALIGEW